MKKMVIVFCTPFIFAMTVFAQPGNPFACWGKAQAASKGKSVGEIRRVITDKMAAIKRKRAEGSIVEAEEYCVVAELMKRVGDYRAPDYYTQAIDAGEAEPTYHFFLAEYWRNFRGAQHPTFPRAEEHYFQTLQKLDRIRGQAWFEATEKQLERGLTALYQNDGVPLLSYNSNSVERPYLFFTTIFNAARNTSDFDRRSEVRDFTSEALVSGQRLFRNLTGDELRGIIRAKDQFETFNRLRLRYRSAPVVDFTYKYREIKRAQITNFFAPNKLNDVNLSEYGVAVEKPLATRAFDLFLSGSFKRARRVGVIEFEPHTKEDINQVEANAVVSRFIGPDKVNAEFTYIFQDIQENRRNRLKRDRSIYAGKLTYQLFRPALQRVYRSRFETRGVDLFGGVLHDNETFGVVDVNKNDYYGGAMLKGYKGFDFTVQPTLFTADLVQDASQKNSQLRTNVNLLYRILDEEKQADNPAFLHLVIPFSRDVAVRGPNSYENYKLGAELNAKLFTTGKRRTTFLASFKYDHQNFFRLKKGVHLYSLNFSLGF